MRKNKMIYMLFCLLVAGCSTVGKSSINVVTQRVEVPISVPCKEEVPVSPEFCFDELTPDADLFKKGVCLLSDRQLHKSYETKLEGVIKACRGEK